MKTVFNEKRSVHLPAPSVKLSDGWWVGVGVVSWYQVILVTAS